MKRILTVLLSALLTLSLAACGAPPKTAAPSESSAPAASQEPEVKPESTVSSEEAAAQPATQRIEVADAAQFIGTVEDLAVNDKGQTVLLLRRPNGAGHFPATLKAAITADTKYSFDSATMGNGSLIEVFYAPLKEDTAGSEVTAIAINDMISEDMVYYNGKLLEITPDPEKKDSGSLLLDPLDGKGMQFLFHYTPETQFYMDFSTLKAGALLNVLHDPAATRSIPPQSAARVVAPYEAPAPGEQPTPIPDAPGAPEVG